MPPFDSLLNAFVTLFVTIDPIGNIPLFLGITVGMVRHERRSVALRGTMTALFILLLFALTGTRILDAMGITIDAFRVAGGLLLFYTAFEMLYANRQERKAEISQSAIREHIANLAVFPLAIPLLAGPGTISATIILSSQLADSSASHWLGVGLLGAIILGILLITLGTLFMAEVLDQYISPTVKTVMTRLLGVLLAAVSVQYVADGVTGLFKGASINC